MALRTAISHVRISRSSTYRSLRLQSHQARILQLRHRTSQRRVRYGVRQLGGSYFRYVVLHEAPGFLQSIDK